MKKREEHGDGFTLLEVLLYSAILSLFLGSAFLVVHNVLTSNRELSLRHEILANHELVGERIHWIFAQAEAIESPAPGETSFTEFRLRTSQASTSPAAFTFFGGEILLSFASGTPTPLTNDRARAANFRATHISHSEASSTLEFLLTLQDPSRVSISSTIVRTFRLPKF